MQTLNQYPRNVQIRAIGKLISKYGHEGTIVTNSTTENVEVLFGKYKLSLTGGTLIINNNYKLHIRKKDGSPFLNAPVPAGSRITVNGAEMVALNVRKIAPDGANAIVWEVEVAGGSIPSDVTTVEIPLVTAPTNGAGFYASAATANGLFSISATASAFNMKYGQGAYVSSDWQIASDALFATVVASGNAAGTWTSPVVLNNTAHYWIRVRHIGTTATSSWSVANEFSLGSMAPIPAAAIATPTIITAVDANGVITGYGTKSSAYNPSTSSVEWKVSPELSAYAPAAGTGALAKSHWQISKTADFAVLEVDQDSTGGYDPSTSTGYNSSQLVMPAVKLKGSTQYYCRGKYISTDGKESAYSPTFMFKCS